MEAPPTDLSPGARNQHVMTFSRMEMSATRDVSDRHVDVLEVGQTVAADAKTATVMHLNKKLCHRKEDSASVVLS